uniref:Phenylalanine--tRNA ligase alpha subunit n=1 Tax=candidate division WOR-3 bacterium TaxID=2052148 RepID=A0A7C4TIC8_UNCW3
MEQKLNKIKSEIEIEISRATDGQKLEELRIKYLGRKGILNMLFKELAALPIEDRKRFGNEINLIKRNLIEELKKRAVERKEERVGIDPLLPGRIGYVGHRHPLSLIQDEIIDFFENLGFAVATGPEIEYDWYNFEALNIPKDHPARDMFSSLYITDELMLRSHTSPVQIRVMERQKPPIKIICPGRCYRFDPFDPSHSPVFHQVEALYVDKGVSFGELKWLLSEFVKAIFGPKTKYELRPSFFPFTEPSGELAISCSVCEGKGCQVCGNTGWLEMLGCGMVHPQVLKNVKISPKEYSGYALGLGIERVAMIKYMIDDIRVFYNNDIRFLEQF